MIDVARYLARRSISRRTLLRGSGAAVSLPLLDAMIPAATADEATVASKASLRRLHYVYIPMGFNPASWTPAVDPASDRLPEELPFSISPLQPVRDHVTVISGTHLRNAYPGSHATSNAAFLSAARAKLTESSDYYLGTTVDQIAAKHIGHQTQLPSLEVAMDLLSTVGQCDKRLRVRLSKQPVLVLADDAAAGRGAPAVGV